MSKDEVKIEIEYLRNKDGLTLRDSIKLEELQSLWSEFAHVDMNGKYTSAPNI